MASLFLSLEPWRSWGQESFLLGPASPPGGGVLRLSRSWGENPSTACGGPPPFGKGGLRRTGPRLRSAPLAKGGRATKWRGDSSARSAQRLRLGGVLRLSRSWGRIPPPPAAVPHPLARGAGDGRGRVLGKPPLLKGGRAGEACEGGIRPPAQLSVSTWGAFFRRVGVGGESLHRLRRSPSLWQGRLTTDGAAAMDKGGGE